MQNLVLLINLQEETKELVQSMVQLLLLRQYVLAIVPTPYGVFMSYVGAVERPPASCGSSISNACSEGIVVWLLFARDCLYQPTSGL